MLSAAASYGAMAPDPLILPAEAGRPAAMRAETIPIANGAQLLVFFEEIEPDGATDARGAEIPLFAVLRDTLSSDDAAARELRQVWIFTCTSPSIAQRIAAGVPFLYHRSGLDSGSAKHAPKPILDMGQPGRGAWRGIAYAITQAEVFDPFGAISRLTTRSYGANLGEYRHTHINEVVDLIDNHASDLSPALSASELEDLSSRLELSMKLLGGYVSDEALPAVFEKNIAADTENRGHNWDVLRQAAERNGLYFEPLRLADAPNSFGTLWIARRDATAPGEHAFDPQFLGIADPFHDERVSTWKGYSRIWTLDRNGARVPDGTPGGSPVPMIPLAVYSLDYPGVPLLMVDFRDPSRPQRGEMGLRLANDVTTGVLGWTTFGNLGYFAAKTGYLFVHKRHGGATDRISRRSAFIELRHALGADESLDPALRTELLSRVERLDLDPVEKSWPQEIRAAWRQYDALMKYAADPKGMARMLDADRWQEYRARHETVRERIAGEFHRRAHTLTPEELAELRDWRVMRAMKQPNDAPAESAPALASDAPVVAATRPAAAGGQ